MRKSLQNGVVVKAHRYPEEGGDDLAVEWPIL
jgi:hypothetical protein